jgi:hypothetical protein
MTYPRYMKRKGLLAIAIVLLLTLATPVQAATPKAGAKCTKAGAIATASGKKFTCVKAGNKLVWNKGVAIKAAPKPSPNPVFKPVEPTPTPTPAPIPTSIPTPIPTPTPLPTPVVPTLSMTEKLWSKGVNGVFPIESEKYPIPADVATTWQNAYVNRDVIPYQAWSAISKNIATSPSKLGSVEILIGPNTVPNFADFKLRMELVSKAFPKAKNVTKSRLFAFNYKDASWADETFKRLYINETTAFKNRHADAVNVICRKEREVCYQQAFVDSKLEGVIFIGMTDIGSREQLDQTFPEYSRAYRGVVIGHEYLHTIQRVIFGDRWYFQEYASHSWFNDGMAIFIENAAANHNSFDTYMQFRAAESAIMYPDCPYSFCVKVQKDQVQSFLSIFNYSPNWLSYPYAIRNQMGARIIEILVALKGPDSLIDVYEHIATGKSFSQAFELVYGISYEAAKPIITSIVVDQIAAGK